jgi:hypothetical protein
VGQKLKKNAQYIFYLYIFISWKKRGDALNIFSILNYTHHRIPNEHMMTINFDTITKTGLEDWAVTISSRPMLSSRVKHSQKSWVILLMNIHKPNRVMYDVSK